jgi:hypothetical protein
LRTSTASAHICFPSFFLGEFCGPDQLNPPQPG